MTLAPRFYFQKLGMSVAQSERVRLRTASGTVNVLLGALDLEVRLGSSSYRWSAQVGFVPRADNLALLGHAGFLDYFSVTFDGLRKRVTLKPNGTFPAPIFNSTYSPPKADPDHDWYCASPWGILRRSLIGPPEAFCAN